MLLGDNLNAENKSHNVVLKMIACGNKGNSTDFMQWSVFTGLQVLEVTV